MSSVNNLVRREWIVAVFVIFTLAGACSPSSGILAVDGGEDTNTSGAPDTARSIDANCDPSLTYASFGMNFFATYCNRCHAWNQESAQSAGSIIVNIAGTSTSMPPATPFPTAAERMQLVDWIDCGAP